MILVTDRLAIPVEELTFTANERQLKRVSDVIKAACEITHRNLTRYTKFKARDLDEFTRMLAVMGRITIHPGKKADSKVYRWNVEC